jgi:hypothetical protein
MGKLETWCKSHEGVITLVSAVAAALALLGYTFRDFISDAAKYVSSFWQPLNTFIGYLAGQHLFWLLVGLLLGLLVGLFLGRLSKKSASTQTASTIEADSDVVLSITGPVSDEVVPPGSVVFKGTVAGNPQKKDHYWLFTKEGNRHWPQTEIDFHADGRWQQSISVGRHFGPRDSTVLLVKLSEFMNAVVYDIKRRSRSANDHGPIEMAPPKEHFSELKEVVLHIAEPAPTPVFDKQEIEWRQRQFDTFVETIPSLANPSYLQKAEQQIQDSLADANGGAAFGEAFKQTFANGQEKQELLNAVSNGMNKYRMILPESVKQFVRGSAKAVKSAQGRQGEIFIETVRTKMPVTLSQWIFADAFKRKDLELLEAAKTLGLHLEALKSVRFQKLAELFQELI